MTLTSAELVGALREHQILEPALWDKIHRALQKRAVEPQALAKELLKHGWLTTYQAELVLQGRTNELVLGEYILLEPLGEGGMGQVFKARHRLMNRTVALKVIRKERLSHPDAVERFHREIRLAAQLDHPHLVRAHDAAQVGDRHFLVMEYAEGTDLQKLIQNSGPLPVSQAADFMRQAALGLQHASERGLVHRDIKPSNLQVTGQGTVIKILDIGLARSQASGAPSTELTQQRMILGTPDYMAPEQIDDARSVDIRADIYSLGCTFYFLLAGRPPFAGYAWEEKLACHRRHEPQPIEQIRVDVPAALAAIIRRMMAKRPEDRFATPAQLAEFLTPFCHLPTNGLPKTVTWGAGAQPGAASTHHGQPAASSLANGPAAQAESGWTLPAPTPVPSPSPQFGPTVLLPGLASSPPAPARSRRPWLLLVAGNALLVVIVLVIVLWQKNGGDSGKKPDNPPVVLNPKKDENQKDEKKDKQNGKPKGEDKGKEKEKIKDKVKEKDKGPEIPAVDENEGKVFIDEDFRSTYGKRALPVGWEGDSFRVAKVKDEPCLEVNKVTNGDGRAAVAAKLPSFVTLPPVKLRGDFVIEGVFHVEPCAFPNASPHYLVLRLENRKTNALLPVVIHESGSILIGDDARSAPPNYKKNLPTKFLVTRIGTELTVILNGEIVGAKNLGEATDFETLKVGLTEGGQIKGGFFGGNSLGMCRVFRLKVATVGARVAGTKNTDKASPAPGVLIDEDFRSTYGKRAIPEGWEGDALRVVKRNEELCLEVNQVSLNPNSFRDPRPPSFVKLPPLKLAGDFAIDGVVVMEPSAIRAFGRKGSEQSLTIRMENRDSSASLRVMIGLNGEVAIGDDLRNASPNYKPGVPTKFLVSRKGNHLDVVLNKEIVASKDLGEAADFDTLRVGLTEGGQDRLGNSLGACRLYRLKVAR